MLNLDETLTASATYFSHYDPFIKAASYSIGTAVAIRILRAQIPETSLLQLVPGVYLILAFSSFIILLLTSEALSRIPQEFDNQKGFGAKTPFKLQTILMLKRSYFYLFSATVFSTIFLMPLSFDSFNLYIESTLENVWSFDEFINISSILLTFLLSLSQVPLFITTLFTGEKDAIVLPKLWKAFLLFAALFSGVVTPTIDWGTQINFSLFLMGLYLVIIYIIEKRISIKFVGLNSLIS